MNGNQKQIIGKPYISTYRPSLQQFASQTQGGGVVTLKGHGEQLAFPTPIEEIHFQKRSASGAVVLPAK
jgi:hypothetical protein